MRRRRWLYWIVVMLIGLLLSAITSAVIYWRHTVPLAETSEVYRQYRHLPGVRAAFIRQMPINDTLRLDMTLLEAEDSAAFADLLRAMGKSEEFVQYIMSIELEEEDRFTGKDEQDNIVVFFPNKKTVVVMGEKDESRQIEIMWNYLNESVKLKNIKKHEESN